MLWGLHACPHARLCQREWIVGCVVVERGRLHVCMPARSRECACLRGLWGVRVWR